MLPEARRTIEQFQMLRANDKVVVAVSGGPDSIALLHVLLTLQAEYKLELYVAHVNHMFRGAEADADADFVEKLCARWNIPCFTLRVDVPARMLERKLSAQVAARETRYQYFKHIAAITGATKIAIGHTADDQAETVLMRFLRGAGPEGLAGISAVRDGIIRPLLWVYREQIEAYCIQEQLEVRRDASNEKPVYLRNRIRNHLIPQLEQEYNNRLRKNMVILADVLQAEETYWASVVDKEAARCIRWQRGEPQILVEPFKNVLPALQRRILRMLCENISLAGVGFLHIEDLRELVIKGAVGQRADLPGGYFAVKKYTTVTVERKLGKRPSEPLKTLPLNIPGHTCVAQLGFEINTSFTIGHNSKEKMEYCFDLDRLHKPICVRTRLPGDKFYHTGIGHRKKLKEFFIDSKVPQDKRDKVLLVTHGDDILWVAGYYVDERFLADADTVRPLRVTIREDE